MNYELGNYYDFLLEKNGKLYEVEGKVFKDNDTVIPDIKTLWIVFPYSIARQMANARVIEIREPKGSVMG